MPDDCCRPDSAAPIHNAPSDPGLITIKTAKFVALVRVAHFARCHVNSPLADMYGGLLRGALDKLDALDVEPAP